MRTLETSRQAAGRRQIDIDDARTALAVEVVMRLDVRVVAGDSARTRDLVDASLRDEHIECGTLLTIETRGGDAIRAHSISLATSDAAPQSSALDFRCTCPHPSHAQDSR